MSMTDLHDMTGHAERVLWLQSRGFVVGDRDPQLNRAFTGRYMVAGVYDTSETPTDDGRNGPWCIVGDNVEDLVRHAYDVWCCE
jgi:hypothetical protein